jgi:DNA-binding MarR family transcriptional regulator
MIATTIFVGTPKDRTMKKRMENDIEQNLAYLLSRTATLLDRVFQQDIADKGLQVTIHQWQFLQKLYQTDGLSQVELASLLEKNGPNVTRILDVMEKNDLITRNADPADRRKYLIHLTSKGREMKAKITPLSQIARDKAFASLSENDLKTFREILNRIYANLA